jgi:ankyrin repeat protein
VCQLDALRKCLSLNALRKALKSLPETLDDTYSRILCSIDEEYSQDAFKILQWLAYSARPLRIREVAEVVAINIRKDNRFNPNDRLREPRGILTICSSLVTIAVSTIQSDFGNTTEVEELRLAHFSVKEYLVSDRIQIGPASRYSIKTCSEATISRTCLTYLLHFKEPNPLGEHHLSDFPLARYAAQYWSQHALAALHDTERINTLIAELFGPNKYPYTNWIRICDPDQPWGTPKITKSFNDVACPLYYASLLGMIEVVRHLLGNDAEVNAQGGRYGNALQAASFQGHNAIVLQLLNEGACVNSQGGEYGNALNAASSQGREAVVRTLLENGARTGARDKEGRTPLSLAAESGHETVVQILLNRADANVAAVDHLSKNALHHAIDNYPRSTGVVQLLLAAGVPATDSDIDNMTPLHYAVVHNSREIADLLINHGVDVDIRVKRETYHAVRKGKDHLQLGSIIEHKIHDIRGLTPLHAAAHFGCCTMVSYLLEIGANPNVSDELSQTPLHLAVRHMFFGTKAEDAWNNYRLMAEAALDYCEDFEGPKYTDIINELGDLRQDLIKRLIEGGSDLRAQDCDGKTPLHVVRYGHYNQSDVVKLMLQTGADPTIQDSGGRTALHIAARSGDSECVLLLVEALIDITVADNEGLNVLHHAAYAGDYQTLEIILRHRDSPILTEAKDKAGLNAIHHNLRGWRTSSKAIEKLVDGGVNPRDVDDSGMTSLHHALASSKLFSCPLEILGTLLAYNINAAEVDLNGMNCLHFAVGSMVPVPIGTLQLLIEKGADFSAADSSGMTVLHHASSAGCINAEMLSFLVTNGVGLNAVDKSGQTPLHHARKNRMSAENSGYYSHIFRAHRWAESEDILVKHGAVELGHD